MTIHVTTLPPDYLELAGRAAMELKSRPRPVLTIIAGGLRRFGDRSPGRADLKIIEGEKPWKS